MVDVCHIVRRGQHYETLATTWSRSIVNGAGSQRTDGFKGQVPTLVTLFLNDYLAANQP